MFDYKKFWAVLFCAAVLVAVSWSFPCRYGNCGLAVAGPFTRGAHTAAKPDGNGTQSVFEMREAERASSGDVIGEDDNPAHGQEAAQMPPAQEAPSVSADTGAPAESPVVVPDVPPAPPVQKPGFVQMQYTRMLRTIAVAQRDMRQRLTVLGKDIADNPWGDSFWMFVALSFLYGVIHALGPGHGKSVVFAYFMSRKGSLARGFLMGHVLTFVHVLSAVLLVFGLRWMLGQSGTQGFDEAGYVMQKVSYGLVTAIGVFMAGHAVYELVTGKLSDRACCMAVPDTGYRGIITVSTLTGLVPCPGAALVLAFALSLGIPMAGLAGVAALAVGMGLTTSMFGVISIFSRSALLYVAGDGPRTLTVLYGILSVGAGLCIAAAGMLMYVSATC